MREGERAAVDDGGRFVTAPRCPLPAPLPIAP